MMIKAVETFLEQGFKGVVLLRHAHREQILEKAVGYNVSITPKGREEALQWGISHRTLPFEKIETSEVLRCLQTAELIKTKLQNPVNIHFSPLLGNPGMFVADKLEAHHHFFSLPLFEILKKMVAGEQIKGMHPVKQAVFQFLRKMHGDPERLKLLITHDSIMIPLACCLFQSSDIDEYQPDFLDNLIIFFDQSRIHCQFKHQRRTIAWEGQ